MHQIAFGGLTKVPSYRKLQNARTKSMDITTEYGSVCLPYKSGVIYIIPSPHESATMYFVVTRLGTAISRLSGPVRLSVRYTTPDVHCRDRRYECNGGIKQ